MKYEPPVLITGTGEARTAFDKSLDGILGVRDNSVVVDIALLSSIHRPGCAQRVAIVIASREELSRPIQILKLWSENENVTVKVNDGSKTPNFEPKANDEIKEESEEQVEDVAVKPKGRSELHNRILVAGRVTSLKDCCVIRLIALHMGGVGVLLSKGNEIHREKTWDGSKNVQAANAVFRDVTASWTSGNDESALDSWGDAQWSQEADIVIPPGWDSVEKIRAVADAFGVPFDLIMKEGTMPLPSTDNVKTFSASTTQSTVDQPDEGPPPFVSWRKKHEQWMALMNEKLQNGLSLKDDHVTTHLSSEHSTRSRNDGDFFQRLLTSNQ